MVNSGYDHMGVVLENRASGYSMGEKLKDKKGFVPIHAPYLDTSVAHAAGALYSTVEDLFLWNQALYTEKLVSKKTLDLMFSPHVETGIDIGDYGYGWWITQRGDARHVHHSGGVYGFRAHISRYPSEKICVIMLSNLDISPLKAVVDGLTAIAFGEPLPPVPQKGNRSDNKPAGKPKGKMTSKAERNARQIFSRLDADEDGKLTYVEFLALKGPREGKEQQFKTIDHDGNGVVSSEELAVYFNSPKTKQ